MLISPYIPVRNRVYIASFSITRARLPTVRACNQQKQLSPIAKAHIRAMSSNPSSPPPLSHILETCIYARDLSASVEFYKGIFNIKPFLETVWSHLSPGSQWQTLTAYIAPDVRILPGTDNSASLPDRKYAWGCSSTKWHDSRAWSHRNNQTQSPHTKRHSYGKEP